MTMAGIQREIIDGKKAYRVGGRIFARKGDVTEAVRAILYRYSLGERLDIPDQEFMADLVRFHRSARQKIGCGIKFITVEQNPSYPTQRGFWITRTNNSRTDFSFVDCISPAPAIRCLKTALREEIAEQKLAAKNSVFDLATSVACPITGETVTRDTAHMDHEEPFTFDVIADRFIELEGIDPDKIEYIGGDGSIGELLANRELAQRWKDYHYRFAKLRAVSIRANLSVLPRKFNAERRADI